MVMSVTSLSALHGGNSFRPLHPWQSPTGKAPPKESVTGHLLVVQAIIFHNAQPAKELPMSRVVAVVPCPTSHYIVFNVGAEKYPMRHPKTAKLLVGG